MILGPHIKIRMLDTIYLEELGFKRVGEVKDCWYKDIFGEGRVVVQIPSIGRYRCWLIGYISGFPLVEREFRSISELKDLVFKYLRIKLDEYIKSGS